MPTLLAVLGICAALLVGGLTVATRARIAFGRTDGAFRCKVRSGHGHLFLPGVCEHWPRWRSRAFWVHDVLMVHIGLLRPRTIALPVRMPDDVIRYAPERTVRGLGTAPLMLRLRLDDGELVDIAANELDRTLLAGPFLAAAIPGLRQARTPRHDDC